MIYERQSGIPQFECTEYEKKTKDYVVLIPIINEGDRIIKELNRANENHVPDYADIVICDGGSTDGCTEETTLKRLNVNTLLVKRDAGKQGAQLRMGIWWALERGYQGIITIDGNNKDSIEDVPRFIEKLEEGYDLIQGSRFVKGGRAVNTPPIRWLSVRLLHAPIISFTAGQHFTDTTNAYRAYSRAYLTHPKVQPLRDIFVGYELLAYLSVRATQLGMKACEIPVCRAYPKNEKTPTKISPWKGNFNLLSILLKNAEDAYVPEGESRGKAAKLIQFLKFLLVGASNSVVLLFVYYLFLLIFHKGYMIGWILGYIAGIGNSFFWNSRYVFQNKQEHSFLSLIKMTASYVLTFFLQSAILRICINMLTISAIIAPWISIIIATPVNFCLNKFFAFRDNA